MGALAGARISREIGWSGWPGGVFLEKKAGLDGLGAYFSRKTHKKYVQISFFHKKSKIHRFLINFFFFDPGDLRDHPEGTGGCLGPKFQWKTTV